MGCNTVQWPALPFCMGVALVCACFAFTCTVVENIRMLYGCLSKDAKLFDILLKALHSDHCAGGPI